MMELFRLLTIAGTDYNQLIYILFSVNVFKISAIVTFLGIIAVQGIDYIISNFFK